MKLLVIFFFVLASSLNVMEVMNPPCGLGCTGPQNCGGACASCRLGICVDQGKCGSYCDPTQSTNLWCYNDYCATCDRATNSCRSDCGGPCVIVSECTNTCPRCSNFKCSTGCSAICRDNTQCAANSDGCTVCNNLTCQSPRGCGAPCQNNENCIHSTDGCTKCIRNKCVQGGCGSICYYTPDCYQQGNCTQCYGRFGPPNDLYGLCTAPCGSACLDNTQCNGTLTNCGLCKNGFCSPSDACGVGCMNDVGCAGNCSVCVTGRCQLGGTCGTACQVNTQCNQSDPRCMFCINQRCGAP